MKERDSMLCYVKGCNSSAKAEVSFFPKQGLLICDGHLDMAKVKAGAAHKKIQILITEFETAIRNLNGELEGPQ